MKKHEKFGIQLWTLKDEMHLNPKDTLSQLASQGYSYIESFEGQQGMFWGMAPVEYSRFLSNMGMKGIGAHCDVFSDFERKAEQAALAGLQYLICPWLGPQEDFEVYLRAADTFNQCGEIARRHGLRFGYHHHDYSFVAYNGRSPMDVFMQRTVSGLVYFEMDIYWVYVAGQDPAYWLDTFPGRWNLLHLKDRAATPDASGKERSTELGKGTIDFPALLARYGQTFDYLIVEQEAFEGTNPVNASAENAGFMRQLLMA